MIVLALFTLMACETNSSSSSNDYELSGDLAGYGLTDYPEKSAIKRARFIDSAGNLTDEGDVLNGKKEGAWIKYHVTRVKGIPQTITNYHKGKKNGPYFLMSRSGYIMEEIFFANDIKHGVSRKYKSGRVTEYAEYDEGKLIGEFRTYYPDGTLQQVSNYKNGIKHGISKFYNQKGEVTIQYTYENGEQIKK